MLVKTLGSIIIIAGATLFGVSQKARLTCRKETLSMFISAFEIMHSEISCMCTSTEELIKRLCNVTSGRVLKFFISLSVLQKERNDLPFALIWNRNVKESDYLELSVQEMQTLSELGNSLGRYNAEETLSAILYTKRRFEGYLKCADDACVKLGKLYGNLSIISGIALVIILI